MCELALDCYIDLDYLPIRILIDIDIYTKPAGA